MIGTARVSWFSLDRKIGFVSLGGTAADAFLHLSVLKSAGYVSVPAGTSMQVRVEPDRGRLRVVEVSNVDASTALAGGAHSNSPRGDDAPVLVGISVSRHQSWA